jgi:hypothetical protein
LSEKALGPVSHNILPVLSKVKRTEGKGYGSESMTGKLGKCSANHIPAKDQ